MGKAPLIAPMTTKDSMFLYHEGFVNVGVRDDIATFLAEQINITPDTIIENVSADSCCMKVKILTLSAR